MFFSVLVKQIETKFQIEMFCFILVVSVLGYFFLLPFLPLAEGRKKGEREDEPENFLLQMKMFVPVCLIRKLKNSMKNFKQNETFLFCLKFFTDTTYRSFA